jgi:DNA ligase D-like protein (predicted polymerase)
MAGKGQPVELTAGGRTVRLSSPDKVYFPEPGYTKRDVAEYYRCVADGITRALRDRPTTLERYPEGVSGESFYQKRAPKNLPDWIDTARISFPSGRHADEICPAEPAAVLWAANLGTLTFHPWPVRRADTDRPDELRIDLDPQPGTGFPEAVRAAKGLREVLAELGLRGWPKTSGGRGLHVFVPIDVCTVQSPPYEPGHAFGQNVSEQIRKVGPPDLLHRDVVLLLYVVPRVAQEIVDVEDRDVHASRPATNSSTCWGSS